MIIPEDASDVLAVSFNDYEESCSGINESGYESFCGQEYSGESNFYSLTEWMYKSYGNVLLIQYVTSIPMELSY